MDSNSRLPVPIKRSLPARRRSDYPALWEQAAPVVARGAALVAAGLIGEWLLRSFARNAINAPRANSKTARKETALVPKSDDALPEGTVAISETTVIMRRLIVRR
jgi:hypothetical protein